MGLSSITTVGVLLDFRDFEAVRIRPTPLPPEFSDPFSRPTATAIACVYAVTSLGVLFWGSYEKYLIYFSKTTVLIFRTCAYSSDI